MLSEWEMMQEAKENKICSRGTCRNELHPNCEHDSNAGVSLENGWKAWSDIGV
jgi:hypothetical protein